MGKCFSLSGSCEAKLEGKRLGQRPGHNCEEARVEFEFELFPRDWGALIAIEEF